MPTSVNYTSLLSDIRNYIERGFTATSDPTVYDQIPRQINAAERKLAQALKLLGQKEVLRDPVGLQAGNSVITKPDRWRATVSMAFGSGADNELNFLYPRAYQYCRAYWPNPTLRATPRFYADYDLEHYLIVPTPDQDYPLELIAYMQPVLLDQANQTNFWTDYTPNLLLYGALLEAAPFLKNDERIATWQGFWQTELVMLGAQDLQRIMDQSAERNKP